MSRIHVLIVDRFSVEELGNDDYELIPQKILPIAREEMLCMVKASLLEIMPSPPQMQLIGDSC